MRAISRVSRVMWLSVGCLVLLAPMAVAQFEEMMNPKPGEDYTACWQRTIRNFAEIQAEAESETIEENIANLNQTLLWGQGDAFISQTKSWIAGMREWPRMARIRKAARAGDKETRDKIRDLITAECEGYAKDWPLIVEPQQVVLDEEKLKQLSPFINPLPKQVKMSGDAIALPILLLAVEEDPMKGLSLLERMFERSQEVADKDKKAKSLGEGHRAFIGNSMVTAIAYAAFGYAQQINGDEKAMTALSPVKRGAVQDVIQIVTEEAAIRTEETGDIDPALGISHRCGRVLYFMQVMCSNE